MELAKLTEECCNIMDKDIDYSFQFLPIEIVVEILEYLPFKDIKSSIMACKQWEEAIVYPKIQKKFHVELSISKALSYQNICTIFHQSTRIYRELQFDTCYRQLESSDIYKLIQNTLPQSLKNIRSLIFDRTRLSFETLFLILSQLTKLQNLKILASDIYHTKIKNISLCETTIESLEKFEMEKTNINNYDSLVTILSMTSNLIEFSINSTSYGNYGQLEIQTRILKEVIEKNSSTLKKIFLKSFEFGEPFAKICNIDKFKNILNLEALSVLIDHRASPYVNDLEYFLSTQTNLEYLDICTFPNIDLKPENFKELKHLKIFACLEYLKDFDLHIIAKFKKLKTLELKGEIILHSDKEAPINTSLEEMTIEMYMIRYFHIEGISKTFINLTVLELCSSKIYDYTMQSIIKSMKKLTTLKIDTYKGTDYGITGRDLETGEQTGSPIWELENLIHLKLFYTKGVEYKSVVNFFKFKNLKTFFCENTKVRWKYTLSTEYVAEIILNCPKLELLRFSYNEVVSKSSLRKLTIIFNNHKQITRDFKNSILIQNLV